MDKLPPGHENFDLNDPHLQSLIQGSGGSCPVMKFNLNERNPGLQVIPTAYELPYITSLDFLFDEKSQYKGPLTPCKLPKFLKKTAFFEEKGLIQTRKLEIMSRYQMYEKIINKGNEKYFMKEYESAIEFYERAVSCFMWIEFIDPENKCPKIELRPYCLPFSEENIFLHNGQNITDENDRDLMKSMLFQSFMNLSAAYLSSQYYKEAKEVLLEAEKMNAESSVFLVRKAQTLLCNKKHNCEDLMVAKECLEKAYDKLKTEKIYQQNQRILLSLNLHDAEHCIKAHLLLIDVFMKEISEFEQKYLNKVFKKINLVIKAKEKFQKLKNDKIKCSESTVKIDDDEKPFEIQVLEKMIKKYIIFFEVHLQKEAQDENKIAMAKKELLCVYKVQHSINYLWELKVEESEKNNIHFKCLLEKYRIDTKDESFKRMWKTYASEVITNIFNKGNFNLQVYQLALSEIIDRREKQRKKVEASKPKPEPLLQKIGLSQLFVLKQANIFFIISLLIAIILLWKIGIFQNVFAALESLNSRYQQFQRITII